MVTTKYSAATSKPATIRIASRPPKKLRKPSSSLLWPKPGRWRPITWVNPRLAASVNQKLSDTKSATWP